MKQKYKRFTNEYCGQISFLHYNHTHLKEYIFTIYEYHLYRKKFDFSKRNYHFNFQCETLCKRLKYEEEKAKIKKCSLQDTKTIFEKFVLNDLLQKQIDNLIGEVKCLPF